MSDSQNGQGVTRLPLARAQYSDSFRKSLSNWPTSSSQHSCTHLRWRQLNGNLSRPHAGQRQPLHRHHFISSTKHLLLARYASHSNTSWFARTHSSHSSLA